MRIALLGTRGIPAHYGGFETFAEELSVRLAARGHEVTVYCRERFSEPTYRGVRLRYLPTVRHKYFDTLAHTFFSTLHLLAHPVDVALYCNGANAVFTLWPRILGIPVALNVDGIERQRKKWNRLAQSWYLLSEWLTTFCPTRGGDRRRHHSGLLPPALWQGEHLHSLRRGDRKNHWPGRSAHSVWSPAAIFSTSAAWNRRIIRWRCARHSRGGDAAQSGAGGRRPVRPAITSAAYATRAIARIVIPGAIYGEGYRELGSHCFAYIHATEVGGTHPALIEAMGRGALVLYRNTPENAEVAGDSGIPFEPEELAAKLREVLEMPEEDRDAFRRRALERVRQRYSWDAVTEAYEQLLAKLAG